jgi:hypothetical protein
MTELTDGLYQVTYQRICAGFVIHRGRLIMCAPILRRRFEYWQRLARRISD